MAQHDGVIDNAAGATVRADINNLAAALLSENSGTSAPSTTYANQPWTDTANHLRKVRNEANTAWIIRGRTDAEGLVTKSAGFTVGLRDYGKTFRCTAALTVAFDAAATLTDGFWCRIINASTGLVTLDPNASEQINGANTLDLRPGEGAYVETDATLFRAISAGPGLVARKVFGLASVISPAQLTANTDNWAPTGIEDCNVIRLSTDASRNITGLTQGWDGRVVVLENVGAQDAVLVHDATSAAANRFYCPTSANYTLKANGAVAVRYDGTSSRWRVMEGAAAGSGGKLVQRTYATYTTATTTSATIPNDDTIPQNTEGAETVTAPITPTSTSNRIRVYAVASIDGGGANGAGAMALFRDAVADALAVQGVNFSATGGGGIPTVGTLLYEELAPSTSPITYKLRVGGIAGITTTIGINANSAGTRKFGGTLAHVLIVEELTP